MTADRLPASPALPAAVAALLDPTPRKILVETRSTEDGTLQLTARDVTIRPLWAELLLAAAPSGQAGGGGRGGGVPLSVDAVDLADRIRIAVDDHARAAGLPPPAVDRRRCRACGWPAAACDILATYSTRTCRLACCALCDGHPHADRTARQLRRLVVHHWTGAEQARDQLTRILVHYTAQAAALLAGDQTSQYVRDTRCPRCQVWDVREWDPAARLEVRHPALLIVRLQARVVGTRCTGCGVGWPWDGLGAEGALGRELAGDRAAQAAEGHVRAC